MKEKINNLIKKFKNDEKSKDEGILKASLSKIILNIVGIILCLIFIPIFIFNVILIIKGVANPDEVPSIFNVSPMIVLSGSMEPVILEGDLVFIKGIDPQDIKIDDIIAYREADEVITHRVIEVLELPDNTLRFKLKGDNNISPDSGYVNEEQIVGIYTGRVGKMGDFAMFLQSTLGIVIFIGTPIVLFLLFDDLRRYFEAKNKQTEASQESSETEALKAEIERLRIIAEGKKNEEIIDDKTDSENKEKEDDKEKEISEQ